MRTAVEFNVRIYIAAERLERGDNLFLICRVSVTSDGWLASRQSVPNIPGTRVYMYFV